MRLLSSKVSRRVFWACFDDKTGACSGESCLDARAFTYGAIWRGFLLSLVFRAIDGFSPSDAALSIPFLLRTLASTVLRDAAGFARSCRRFSQESSGFTSALWIEVLDILRYAFPL